MRRHVSVAVLALTCVVTNVARCQEPRPDAPALLRRFDTDGDGKIDEKERRAVRELLRQRQSRPGATTPSGRPETVGKRLVTELEYASSDGRKIPCVLSMPQGEGPFPVLVTIHGGQGDRELAFIRSMAAPGGVSPTITAFNEQPWAILAISYRAGNGALFGMEHDDVIAGIRFAKTLPRIDPERVGVVGGSHGGHLALVAAEKMGGEFLCVAAASPWMTDPLVSLTGDPERPPLAEVPADPREAIVRTGRKLFENLKRGRGMTDEQAREFLARHSIEAHAGSIEIPTLFITSRGDDQVPHALVAPMIEKMRAAGKEVEVSTAEKSPHGFYWARAAGAARALRGEKTPAEAREEEEARRRMIDFFTRHFAAAAAVAQPVDGPTPGGGTEAPAPEPGDRQGASDDERIAGIGVVVATLPRAAERDWPKPTVPVPAVVMLGTEDTFKPWIGSRDQFSAAETVAFWRRVNGCGAAPVRNELPDRDLADGCRVTVESWEGKAPVVFYNLEGHGHGWPMQRGKADTGTGAKTRDISAPEALWAFLQDKTR